MIDLAHEIIGIFIHFIHSASINSLFKFSDTGLCTSESVIAGRVRSVVMGFVSALAILLTDSRSVVAVASCRVLRLCNFLCN